ncbi:DUF4190 domain-containing protein [Mariniplasma anaerobium]|uniref:Zinc-ribbon domain-containing protein n=1 Tax=Mariniplasma anaerobium TaxID=2735436 RepID=A0A7U9XV17_9MOLU|nr:DUF4190 domain-containing protein [Mariniplasma anaerobium]BCR35678.1 hypothetical protein MPAN_005710 [Mariniplasma anaerobium]
MYCKMCGREMDDDAKFCPSCGEPVEDDMFETEESSETKKSRDYNLETLLGVLAIVFSLMNYLGVFFVHLIGIALGSIVLNLVNRDKKEKKIFSQIGYVTGIIGLLLGIVAIVIGISTQF